MGKGTKPETTGNVIGPTRRQTSRDMAQVQERSGGPLPDQGDPDGAHEERGNPTDQEATKEVGRDPRKPLLSNSSKGSGEWTGG